jgi:hypothetical protein
MEQFTREYGDMDVGFYMSIEETFHKALKIIDKQHLQIEFYPNIKSIAEKIIDFRYGRGFSDQIGHYFEERELRNIHLLGEKKIAF